MMKRVSEAEEACLNLTWSEIPKTHFRMAWLICKQKKENWEPDLQSWFDKLTIWCQLNFY